ncbi:MAG TPA: S41 family peptidase [Nitrospiria bacterium]
MGFPFSKFFSYFFFGAVFLCAPSVWGETRLLRFPDIHQEKVVFCYAGDLWQVGSKGGQASRLTSHPGQELFPKFSPDGQWIAFTGQYDGDEQVYVIPSEGGIPKQLTFYPAQPSIPSRFGFDHQVYGWTSDGSQILFRSLRYAWHYNMGKLFTVPFQGGFPQPLPMPSSGAGDFSPDGKKMIYSPLMRDFRTWKRYEGGWAQNLFIFDLKTFQTEKITSTPRSDRDPMWIGDTIYYVSDRDGKLNLFSYHPSTQKTRQLTHYKEYDLRWPSSDGQEQIIFELNGTLHIFNLKSEQTRPLSISVPNDGVAMRPSRISAEKFIESFAFSPKGERALFAARGDIFSVPVEKGPTRNLTQSSYAHDKWPAWSPKGNHVVFLSDRSGEEELFLIPQDGSGDLEPLTQGGNAMRYLPKWSPDEKRIALSDKNGKIFILDIKTKKLSEIADDQVGQVVDYTWSGDGNYLAFSLSDDTYYRSIYIWDIKNKKLQRVTGSFFSEFNPVWDPQGNYLFFLGVRAFNPQGGAIEPNFILNREVSIYALALRKDVPHPFPPESDEVSPGEDMQKDTENEKEKNKGKNQMIKGPIDFEGLSERITQVPVQADNYEELSATEGYLLYRKTGPSYFGRNSDVIPSLYLFSIQDRKATLLAEHVSGYQVSHDGKKIIAKQGAQFWVYEATPKGKETKKKIPTNGLMVDRIPSEEWVQIFEEVWRRFRDFFYVENMHGYPWEEIRERYRPLLKDVAHRADLNYVLGEMVSELNVSHAYVSGGDFEIPPRPQVALPGARFEIDPSVKRFRIGKIYQGQNEEARYRSPLREIGVHVEEGEYVMAINGKDLTTEVNPYQWLRHKADQPIQMTVNKKPTLEGAREVVFQPLTREDQLLYFSWVDRNRQMVSEKTKGRVGYLHLPDMGANGLREFTKWFYGQIRKEGLIIDIRGNGGGYVSQMVIERLKRELLALQYSRNSDIPHPYPSMAFHGHMVGILDETSASDADIFSAMFQKAGLGPLIGKRSWGGVVGIQNHGPLIDGGSVFVPEFGFASDDGRWIIENYGVEPDRVVENDPQSVIQGKDLQLERAIQEVMDRIQRDPRRFPPKPPDPIKTE